MNNKILYVQSRMYKDDRFIVLLLSKTRVFIKNIGILNYKFDFSPKDIKCLLLPQIHKHTMDYSNVFYDILSEI